MSITSDDSLFARRHYVLDIILLGETRRDQPSVLQDDRHRRSRRRRRRRRRK